MRERSEAIFCQEVDFAIHLSIEKIVIDLPEMDSCENINNLARVMNKYFEDVTLVQKFIVRMRLSPNEDEAENLYQRYLQLKSLCSHTTRIQLALVFESELPSDEYINRFWSDPIYHLELSPNVFMKNKKNYPVLS